MVWFKIFHLCRVSSYFFTVITHVCVFSLAFSGKAIVDLDMQEIEDKSAKSIKRWLAGPDWIVKVPAKAVLEDHSEVTDDDLPLAPQNIRLVALDFLPGWCPRKTKSSCLQAVRGDVTKVETYPPTTQKSQSGWCQWDDANALCSREWLCRMHAFCS